MPTTTVRKGLSRDVVGDAAIRLIDEEGFEALTIRRLAGILGVAPMALYVHVRNRDDLMDLVVTARLEDAVASVHLPAAWDDAIETYARWSYSTLTAHPEILASVLRRPLTMRGALQLVDDLCSRLVEAGWSKDEAAETYLQIMAIVVGCSSLTVHRRGETADARSLTPLLTEVQSTMRDIGSARHLDHALGGLLSGLRARRLAVAA